MLLENYKNNYIVKFVNAEFLHIHVSDLTDFLVTEISYKFFFKTKANSIYFDFLYSLLIADFLFDEIYVILL